MRLPIGYDNFGEIMRRQLDFVDKSLFIKDIIDNETFQVLLITRPRRFGKTLNLSMLEHFFAAEVTMQQTQGLFDNLKIAKVDNGNYLKHQGKYPVISISFKDIKDYSFEVAYSKLQELIIRVYEEHNYLATSTKLTQEQKQAFKLTLRREANQGQLENSLLVLCKFLHMHHGIKPYLLIDEYDTPIHSAYLNGYYEEMINFMRNMFGAALKTNPYLEKAVITGILRVAKESLFSGLNNLKVYPILHQEYSQYFGFTEDEVNELLERANLENKSAEIKHWYNGYQFGDNVIYNPWSMVNCLNDHGNLAPYWLNTSDNALIKKLFAEADKETKLQLETLIRNEPIEAIIDEFVAFTNFSVNPVAIWSLLLSSGYLKATTCTPFDGLLKCQLLPPNYEVSLIYRSMVKGWLAERLGYEQYDAFLGALLKGNLLDFSKMLKKFLVETLSIFDVAGNNPEKFYHGFVLGLISSTLNTHIIKSNRESGFGRYDVMIFPKEIKPESIGLILEFKVADDDEELKKSAKEALEQINKRGYEVEMRQSNIKNIIKVGLAFRGKNVEVLYE